MTMHRVRRRKAREERDLDFFQVFDLIAGPHEAFDSDEERREAWEEHRDEILRLRVKQEAFGWGRRPKAFWQYDHPGVPDMIYDQVAYLARNGLLEPHEILNIRNPDRRADGVMQPWSLEALAGLEAGLGTGHAA